MVSSHTRPCSPSTDLAVVVATSTSRRGWGFPVWLKYVPGISFETDNGPFKAEMQKFVEKIVSMMKY
ncbi:hypothetical protein GUJ93_ZPchr0004g39186 [Zizania palustris]|uniref:Glycoside hydrolase 35 catalytic domain-containing protein n=1 Tax=Zizania palustris TaxID=103762 RepID=A0A8J5SJC0_ZIZPA|nr:hypothetical protein GUJ93_ZPchr0004g39186 [Zizania palustris]